MGIEFKDDAVCFADGKQWRYFCNGGADTLLIDRFANGARFDYVLMCEDLQLNTIKQGDYIEASELDSHKYNDAVEVFGLFGCEPSAAALNLNSSKSKSLTCVAGEVWRGFVVELAKRKLTFNQLMAIGELKRLMNERDKSNHSEKPNGSVSKVNRDIDAFKDGNKYHREIIGLDGTKTTVDVYRVLDAFKTDCSATDHAIKKMLCAGLRGHKDKLTDYDNAIESLGQARALLVQKEIK